MANDVTGKIWTIDTAAVITTGPVKVERMEWKPSAAADDLTILDRGDHAIWDVDAIAAAPAGTETFKQGEAMVFQGFNVSVIDGGTLYVTIK